MSEKSTVIVTQGSFQKTLVSFFVIFFERYMPDPFVIALLLTFVTAVLAMILAPHGSPGAILDAWYGGAFKIVAFAFQMMLILVTGHAVAGAAPVRRILSRLVAWVSTPGQAVLMMFVLVVPATWFNWGLGLVVGAFVAREIARHIRVDYGWLVACGYTAWWICNSGLSSSIALSQATHGNPMNIVEQMTGQMVPLRATLFSAFTVVPTVLTVIVSALVFPFFCPAPQQSVYLEAHDDGITAPIRRSGPRSPRSATEQSVILSFAIALFAFAALILRWREHGFGFDIDSLILSFLILGLMLQKTPIAYVGAVREAISQTGPILLQFPFYGGIMGIMTATGLAGVISEFFVHVASAQTLPFWSFVSSLIITFLVPSAGGHWAVQGPFVVPAAMSLHASIPHVIMGVAIAENVANMLQPFWAVPIVAIAGIGIQRVMAFTSITFLISLVICCVSVFLLG
ncbi:TIGR00366 family protein [Acetobacter fallax]|uniref:Short-chain fatty acid transporter n=1 Tax=Acetobacter fallax TaxID=1737473 RepID=A0ABX0K9D2_9PROT|nr:TIGR00366 family protein [Acetobacter fallax]NHO33025.1 short-chain fatty acid transporter [Acetobacter fallax]NHO36607.1 short-chain fatty acid transporter [Acetobacter fallax]